MKKTKIICTMGPATADDEVLKEIMRSGMDVARINFSHGNGAEHLPKVEQIKRLRKELGLPNDLLKRIKEDPAFDLKDEEMDEILKPEKYIGRANEQVEEFVNEYINPIIKNEEKYTGSSEMKV